MIGDESESLMLMCGDVVDLPPPILTRWQFENIHVRHDKSATSTSQ